MRIENSGKLSVVGTPIGNLGDLSPRGAACLAACDFIAAEDTRVTAKLLNHLGIKKSMLSYHEHNRREREELILSRILAGEHCALVTDAGMPAISDPGEELVRACQEQGIPAEAIPGPTAFATALALSGMPSGRFCFEGFLSVNKRGRGEHLLSLRDEQRTMLFYEAPHKLPRTLQDLSLTFGDRPLAIVRELTKIHEQVIKTTCGEAAQQYADGSLKGEIVLVLQGAPPKEPKQLSLEEALSLAHAFLERGMKKSEAARRTAKESGRPKNEIYDAINR
ncbi:MAG: 16S rRNA (cytidine(1402)-2'-O)-methyltransferase [Oscillospiraceae bacterium]|nr:16S rRNA (cytidine(1402)-2'-O)-methyltransferase [Oscillospiraceae bacterium]